MAELQAQLEQSNAAASQFQRSGKPEDLAAVFQSNPFMGFLGPTAVKIPRGAIGDELLAKYFQGRSSEIAALKNPTRIQIQQFVKRWGDARGVQTKNGDLYIFRADDAIHEEVAHGLGQDPLKIGGFHFSTDGTVQGYKPAPGRRYPIMAIPPGTKLEDAPLLGKAKR